MPLRRKLIVVSNRGPTTFGRDENGARVARRGGGGLVTALRSLVSHHDVTWVASAISDEDRAVAAEAGGEAFDETGRDGSPYRLRLVPHDEQAYDWHYNVVSNPTLWFLQHYLWALAQAPNVNRGLHYAWDEGYVAVNRGFADAVLAELDREPEAAVFFHDYHLYLAPRMVRDEAPDATLAHFMHIPWAQPDYWYVLPESIRRAIHDGVLANDVVGFHTRRWRRNFLRSCFDVVGATFDADFESAEYEGRRILVTAHPISVDVGEFEELATSPRVLAAEREIVERRPDFLVLRVDRTDPSKNVVRVVNDRFQREGWTPIELQIRDDFPQAVAAYKQFDVLLVNAIYDGLNLVAKEAPLVNERDGVLVLSENAGVHEELGEWALSVNPFDISGQAEAIHAALQLSAGDRRARLEAIRAHVREHDLGAWIAAQLVDLDRGAALLQG